MELHKGKVPIPTPDDFKTAIDKYNAEHEHKIRLPTDAEIRRGFEIIDEQSTKRGDIRTEPDPQRRDRLIDSIVYGMVAFGEYHPMVTKSLMLLWLVGNGVDAN